ncbi:hypothetical protein BV22DRAFT_1117606 [Leucogyrophana mollusca]|uniref:Uncharacterized protein n=1 Tax=Leucogyrophana mollusca TaxID=85980 RepID=A0ACB8BT69_9AGAM|nr:hypothetical protein BV22DRAFT_1117606 [Leucogyrophana mollusca]
MIVEALLDAGDADGCAPKSLFAWMAAHYPLQTNFRPSASQALQKAFKRGRLEKGSNGRYRLNTAWEGGNTSRRTTRRPQTHAQTTLSAPQAPAPAPSPFTHAPLAHPGPSPPYPGYGYPGYAQKTTPHTSTHAAPHTAAHTTPQPQSQPQNQNAPQPAPADETGEGSDAWEAAQSILKAINFGQLLQMSAEGDGADSRAGADGGAGVGAGLPVEGSVGGGGDADDDGGGRTPQAGLTGDERAALQAQLALLAAQLAEMADEGAGEEQEQEGVGEEQGQEGAGEEQEQEQDQEQEQEQDGDSDDEADMEMVAICD